MMRVYLFGGMLALLIGALLWAYINGKEAAKAESERDNMRSTIQNSEKFNEAADDDAGTGWYERLFPDTNTD